MFTRIKNWWSGPEAIIPTVETEHTPSPLAVVNLIETTVPSEPSESEVVESKPEKVVQLASEWIGAIR